MALTKAKKNEKVKMLATELESSTSAIIGTFKGLTASKDFELRKVIRDAGGSYHVVKNKLAAKSSQGTKVEAALQGLKGVNSVAYTSGDPVALAKALSTWVKDNAEYTFKLGIVDGRVITVAEIDSLAKLPGKEELFSKLLFLIQSPAQRLATVINATGRDLAVVINQAVEKGKFGAPAAKVEAIEAFPTSVNNQITATAPASEAAAAHVEEAAAGEQPSGAAQPENGTATQAGEAASSEPAEGSEPAAE
jgi:large subunit ribosomal protein L10